MSVEVKTVAQIEGMTVELSYSFGHSVSIFSSGDVDYLVVGGEAIAKVEVDAWSGEGGGGSLEWTHL